MFCLLAEKFPLLPFSCHANCDLLCMFDLFTINKQNTGLNIEAFFIGRKNFILIWNTDYNLNCVLGKNFLRIFKQLCWGSFFGSNLKFINTENSPLYFLHKQMNCYEQSTVSITQFQWQNRNSFLRI